MENWEWNVQHSEEFRIQSRTQLRSWQKISFDNSMPLDDSGFFYRPDPRHELQFIPGSQEAGSFLPISLGKTKGLIWICKVVLLGVLVSVHNREKAAWYVLNRGPCFVVFDCVSLSYSDFFKDAKSSRARIDGIAFFLKKYDWKSDAYYFSSGNSCQNVIIMRLLQKKRISELRFFCIRWLFALRSIF